MLHAFNKDGMVDYDKTKTTLLMAFKIKLIKLISYLTGICANRTTEISNLNKHPRGKSMRGLFLKGF